ncbi:MAG: 1-acyl-sn-glycerol-3-phosphate acyltransferase [Pseudonocardiaceae bacterium]|nr:1-acyl-sn-glycerol-3-phosphate acyltransferase [Pseudonocardiaceae bacterium]
MVASNAAGPLPTRRGEVHLRPPPAGRLLQRTGCLVTALTGSLELSGAVPERLRGRPFLLVANHVGVFDTAVLLAACDRLGIAPRFVTNGGLFDTPLLGRLLRSAGHLRVDPLAAGSAVRAAVRLPALDSGGPVLIYPEGRVSRDPGLWPERGHTGAARLALLTGLPVLPLSQWGAQEVIPWHTPPVRSLQALATLIGVWLRAMDPRNRHRFRVHLGEPVDLGDLRSGRPGDAMRAHTRIMRAITEGLVPLRADDPAPSRIPDPTRPVGTPSPWTPS